MDLNLDKYYLWILKIFYPLIDLLKSQQKVQSQQVVDQAVMEEDLEVLEVLEAKDSRVDQNSKVEIDLLVVISVEISEEEMLEDLQNQFKKDDKLNI